MSKDRLIEILDTIKGNWAYESIREDLFKEYIKSWMQQLNKDCKAAGWKSKKNLVQYENRYKHGKVICFIEPEVEVALTFKELKLSEKIDLFEQEKEVIQRKAFEFIISWNNNIKKLTLLEKEIIELMKSHRYFIENDKITVTRQTYNQTIRLVFKYRGKIITLINLDIRKPVASYNVKSLIRNAVRGAKNVIMQELYICLYNNKKLSDREINAAIKYCIKTQDDYRAQRISSNKYLSTQQVDKLQSLITASTLVKKYHD